MIFCPSILSSDASIFRIPPPIKHDYISPSPVPKRSFQEIPQFQIISKEEITYKKIYLGIRQI
ncbi:MAG: hypothetical protein C5S48_03645 [Candidatus Methanogaster sp.]|nr:MAG: hypothetical protein C5S48_03645 [ANME-2 cluster archaeon]